MEVSILVKREVDRRAEIAGAVAGLLPGGSALEYFTKGGVQSVLLEWERLRSPAIVAATRACGLTTTEIAEQLETQPHLVPLAARVLFHAGMTNQDEILEALGAMLGALVLTPDDTDVAELIIIGLGDLRRVHLQVLRALEGDPIFRTKREGSTPPVDASEDARTDDNSRSDVQDAEIITSESETWNAEALAFESGLPVDRTMLALAGLVKAGFVLTPTVLNGPGYLISPAGEMVLEVLRRYQTEAPVRRRPSSSPESH